MGSPIPARYPCRKECLEDLLRLLAGNPTPVSLTEIKQLTIAGFRLAGKLIPSVVSFMASTREHKVMKTAAVAHVCHDLGKILSKLDTD